MNLVQILIQVYAAFGTIGENKKLVVDDHNGLQRILSEDTNINQLRRKKVIITVVNTHHPNNLAVNEVPVCDHDQPIRHKEVQQDSHLTMHLLFGVRPHHIASQYGAKKYKYSLTSAKIQIQNLLKSRKIVALASLIVMVPGVDALSNFDLKKTIPAVYSQLAQNAVIASFGVFCSSDGNRSPLDALADGPLSSISSAVWLWRTRKVDDEKRALVEFTALQATYMTVPGGPMKLLVLDCLPAIAITSASFIIYLLSFLESMEWKWALTVTASGLASEGTRLLATYLSTISVQKEFFEPRDLSERKVFSYLSNEAEQRPFIECHDGKIRPSRYWQKFTNRSTAVKCILLGSEYYHWRWVNIRQAIMSLLLFCLSALFGIISTGALVASEDGSLAGGFLSFIICYCAAGKLNKGASVDTPHPDMYDTLIAARRLEALSEGHIKLSSYQNILDLGGFVFYSLMTTSDTITYKGKKCQAYKPEPGGLIDMHSVYQRYAIMNPIMNRVFNIVEDDTGRSVMLEIADALYCRALLLIRHAHQCRSIQPSVRGQVCNANVGDLLSALLLISDHVECQDVCDILYEIKAWMNDEYLLWSIIGSHVTLEMMVLPYLRKQLESSNTLDLALRICHMAMFEAVPTEIMLEAVPTALYYLLTGSTILGHATARVVERAIDTFEAANIIPGHDEVILTVDDRYTIQCQGKLHPWPGGFIPVLLEEAITNQPANYNLARAVFGPMLNRQTLTQQDETLYISPFPI
ncbi:hypothetical protein BC943DRAFT_329837, partial [Umbelopsis sp. AD052]